MVALILIPLTSIADSLNIQIGKDATKINIAIPDGYCLLDKSEPSDNRLLTTFDLQAKGKHRRLAFMVNCKQLRAWRNSNLLTLDDFGYVLLDARYVDKSIDKPIDEFLNDMVDEIGHGRKNVIRHRGNGFLQRYIAERVKELEQGPSVDLGLIHRDNLALYTAGLDRITTETGEQKLFGEVRAITRVNGKPLFFYLFRELENIRVIGALESDLSDWIQSLHQSN
jgi:hypothetical protein